MYVVGRNVRGRNPVVIPYTLETLLLSVIWTSSQEKLSALRRCHFYFSPSRLYYITLYSRRSVAYMPSLIFGSSVETCSIRLSADPTYKLGPTAQHLDDV